METEEIKDIPYGVSRFEQVAQENLYYVDKTSYLPQLEEADNCLFLVRPRRFGKSLLLSMMRAYYDTAYAPRFDTLFNGLWVKDHPTPLKNAFQVLSLDYSRVTVFIGGSLKENFEMYCNSMVYDFVKRYADFYSKELVQAVSDCDDSITQLNLIHAEAQAKGYQLYLMVDEHDNFVTTLLGGGRDNLHEKLDEAAAFYPEYFKTFQKVFQRMIFVGVSPVAMEELSCRYMVEHNISRSGQFDRMLGYTEEEVRKMLNYYQAAGQLEGDVEEMLRDLKRWYGNYHFSTEDTDGDGLLKCFNCAGVLFYIKHLMMNGSLPGDMADKNVRTDLGKMERLGVVQTGEAPRPTGRMDVVEQIATQGSLDMNLKAAFLASEVDNQENFNSLFYYYGLLTTGGDGQIVIPNLCAKVQYWDYLRMHYYRRASSLNPDDLYDALYEMEVKGDWKPVVEMLVKAYHENVAQRDFMAGEKHLLTFFRANLTVSNIFYMEPKTGVPCEASDLLLLTNPKRSRKALRSFILELKCAAPKATQAEVVVMEKEAEARLNQLSQDEAVQSLADGSQIYRLVVVLKGTEIAVMKELD